MSGGSYNYLCYKDAQDIVRYQSDLRDMANSLTSRGFHDAAAETEAIIAFIEHAERQLSARIARLSPVWKAVEWHQSGDWSEKEVNEVIYAYRIAGIPTTQPAKDQP